MLSKRKSKSNKKKSYKKSGGAAFLLSGLKTLPGLIASGAASGAGMVAIMPYVQQLTGEDVKEAKKMQLEKDVIKKGDEVIKSNDKNTKEQRRTQATLATGAILFLAYKIYDKYKHKKSPKKSPKIDDDQKSSISEQIKKLLDSKIFLSIVAALIFYFRKK